MTERGLGRANGRSAPARHRAGFPLHSGFVRAAVPLCLSAVLVAPALVTPALGGAAGAPAVAPVARAVRSWTSPENTRIVLDLSCSTTFRLEADSLGRRLRVVLPGTLLAPDLVAPPLDDGAVSSLTLGESAEGLVLSVGLVEWTSPQVFDLDEAPGMPPRLVIDVPRPGQAAREASERQLLTRIATSKERVVVIDPGHGGEATGAIGPHRTMEKDVTLAIARRLAGRLAQAPGVQVVLTRTGDYDVPLRERFRIAERYQADAFVSIHTNSSRRRTGRGTEVYFLSLESASDEAAKALADLENAADKISGVPPKADDELVGILFDLKQNEAIQQSSSLAESILSEIEGARKLESRGVKQAPFAVLKSPVVPSVLVETAFINNPAEVKLLRDPGFQEEMAGQIATGVLHYLATAPPVARTKGPLGAATPALGLVRESEPH